MKTFSGFGLLIVTCFCCLQEYSVRAQFFQPPSRNFKPITFDLLHRGSYRSNFCINELINCWEVIKRDVICERKEFYESVCGMVHSVVCDLRADYMKNEFYYYAKVYESHCMYDYYT